MTVNKTDSSSNPEYHEKVKEKDLARKILKKHLDEISIDLSSRFGYASLKAMMEFKHSKQ